jgi:hypothetical protein
MTAVDVRIPADKVGTVQSDDCVRWLVDEALAGVEGRVFDGEFFLRFGDAREAERFTERWLTHVR